MIEEGIRDTLTLAQLAALLNEVSESGANRPVCI